MGGRSKRIGLIGGTSWESTLEYYRLINPRSGAVGASIRRRGLHRLALFGTLETMQGSFYRDRLREAWQVDAIVPGPQVQARVHEIALSEVARGLRTERSRAEPVSFVRDLCTSEADGVILGCTELPLLLSQADVDVPVFDSLSLHVDAIVDHALR
jgi:aspartate racemase